MMENPGFDPGASTLLTLRSSDWASPPRVLRVKINFFNIIYSVLLMTGIEPATVGLLDQCSTDWATRAYITYDNFNICVPPQKN